jgi:ATP-binding cassette subfamily B protein
VKSLRRLLPWLRPYRRVLLLGFVWVIVTNALLLMIPQLLRLGVDAIEQGQWQDVQFYAGMIVLATLAGGAIRIISRLHFLHTGRRVEVDLRRAMFERLLYQPGPFFNQHRIGDLVSRFTNDLTNVRMVTGFGLVSLVNAAVVYTISISLMVWMSPSLTVAALLPFPLLLLGIKKVSRRLLHYSGQVQERLGSISDMVEESIRGQLSLRSSGFQQVRCAQFDDLNAHYLDAAIGMAKMRALIGPIMSIVTPMGILLVLYFGGRQVIAGTLQLGDLVAFNAYLVQLTMPTMLLGWILTLVQRAAVGMERISLLLDLDEPAPQLETPPEATKAPHITLRDANFGFHADKPVLHHLNLDIPAGSTLGITGGVASGKSALLHLLSGRYPVAPGQVFIDGEDMAHIDRQRHSQRLCAVLQEGKLFSGTLADNLRFAAPDLAPEALKEITRTVALANEIEQFRHGLETRIGEGGLTLSGGQRQRVGIARALARDRGLWLLDDPFSHLDTVTSRKVWEALREQIQERTLLFASSRVSILQGADHIIVLNSGEIIEQGNHTSLLELKGEYARLWEREQLHREMEGL